MRKTALIPLLLLALSAVAAEPPGGPPAGEPLRLKDGSYLFIDEQTGTMRMTDQDGKPIEMKEGVEMELENGDLIMMQNNRIWRHDHRTFKNY